MQKFDPGFGAAGVLVLSTVLAVLLAIGIPIGLAPDPIKISDWLGFAGNVLTGGIAAIAIYFAWRGITHQQRILLLSREEDRIEEELPGLNDAEMLLDFMHTSLLLRLKKPDFVEQVFRSLENVGFRSVLSDGIQEIQTALPYTDIRTRGLCRNAVGLILATAELARRKVRSRGDVEAERRTLERAVAKLKPLILRIQRRIATLEKRLPSLRSEIEMHLS